MTLTLVIVLNGFLLSWSGPAGNFIVVPTATAQIRPMADATGYYAFQGQSQQVLLGKEWTGFCFQAWAFNAQQGPYTSSNLVCTGGMPKAPSGLHINL